MKQIIGLALALVIGIVIGAWGVPKLWAQTSPRMTYVVADMRATDPAGFTEYMRGEGGTLATFHGRIVARALPEAREGTPPDGVVTIYAFDSPQDANNWYYSPAYAPLKQLREKSAQSRLFFVTGIVSR
jgi:uncharacterized protein (DUF1330 family)